jgi:two-component system cell cycle response regulator CtrA
MEQSKASVLGQKQFEVNDKETNVASLRTMIGDFDNMIEGHAQSVIGTGELKVNLDTKTVEVNGQRVHLTSKEYQMLELLSLRKGTTLTKEMFLNHLYGGMDEPELKIIDVFICKLRKKLQAATRGQHYIETVWGRGYVLRDPADAHVAA